MTRGSVGDAPIVVALLEAAAPNGPVYDYEVLPEAGRYYLAGQAGA